MPAVVDMLIVASTVGVVPNARTYAGAPRSGAARRRSGPRRGIVTCVVARIEVAVHPSLVHVTVGTVPVLLLAYVLARRRASPAWTFAGDVTLGVTAAVTVAATAFGFVSFLLVGWPGRARALALTPPRARRRPRKRPFGLFQYLETADNFVRTFEEIATAVS